ncbi:uncharacterized protein LOC144919123 [Branchiostoma floridae x Branchiostoma belcheri]
MEVTYFLRNLEQGQESLKEGQDRLKRGQDSLEEGQDRLKRGQDSLEEGQDRLERGQNRLEREQERLKEGQDSLKEGHDSLKEGQGSLKRGQDSLKEELTEGQRRLEREQESLKRGQVSLEEGQDRLKRGQDSLERGQNSLERGQNSLEREQESLKEGQDSLKEGQDSLKEGQDRLKRGQDGLKEGQRCLERGQDSLKEGQRCLEREQESLKRGQVSLEEGQGILKRGQDSLERGQNSLKWGQNSLEREQESLKEGQDSLKEGQDSLKEGQGSLNLGQDSLEEGHDCLKEGQGILKKGQDSLKEGQDSLKEGQGSLNLGQDSLEEGHDCLKEGQGILKKGQDSLKEGQDSLKEGQGSLNLGQDSLEEGHDCLKEGQGILKKGQGSLMEGQDILKKGQDSLKKGQDSLKKEQGSLKKGQDSLKERQGSLKEGQDSLKEGQDNLKEGQDILKKGQASLKEGQDSLKEGQDSLKEGQDSLKKVQGSLKEGQGILKEGQASLKEGQDSLKKVQGSLKEGQDNLKEGQDSLKEELTEGQSRLEEGQDSLKEGQNELKTLFLEYFRGTQRQSSGVSTKPCVESSWQTDHDTATGSPDDIIANLKDLYRTEYAQVRPLPWCEDLNLQPGEIYTDLQLQPRDGRGRFQDTDIITLTAIYSSVRKIRVEGDPGIGKSWSCQKLAYDWSCGKLDRFKVVFFLEMRHLAGKVKDEIFEQLLPKDTNTTPDQLWSYIQQIQDGVLFILDGLDELSQAARQVTDIVDLIQGKILRNCHVLVTSRPYHCVKDLEKCHQFYSIVGYSEEKSEDFIRKYFCKSPESALQLVKQIHSNRNLSELVVNPLNNLLICVVWEDNNGQLPSNKAELYDMIVLSVAKRFCAKKALPTEGNKLPPDIKAALRGLGKLSWEGLDEEQLQFNIAEIRKTYGTNADNMLTLGLLTRDYSFSRIKRTCFCAFLHKTFQEYMAAHYISGLFTGGSREEGMKCLRRLFGLTKAPGVDRELILYSRRKYREVQDWLLLILGENANPLFDMFAEELNKVENDEDRELLSFVCLTWLGRTECAGVKMAEIVAPCLSQHATNNLGNFSKDYGRHRDWFVGLTQVLTCQKKQTVSDNLRLTQHLTFNCSYINDDAGSSDREKLDVLVDTLSDYCALHSVTFHETDVPGVRLRAVDHTFSPLRAFVPRCGTGSVFIHINPFLNPPNTLYLSLLSSLQQLSMASRIEHIRITVGRLVMGARGNFGDTPDADFSEYDRLLAQMIVRQNCLRSLRLEIGEWYRYDPEVRGFGNLTETLQSISQHATLEEVEFELPGNDVSMTKNVGFAVKEIPETFEVEPMVHELTECIKKNKVLKALRLRWKQWDPENMTNITKKVYHGTCSSESLSSLCSAIQENQTLETLVVEGMICNGLCKGFEMFLESLGHQEIIDELMRNKPSNYKDIRIIMFDCVSQVAIDSSVDINFC